MQRRQRLPSVVIIGRPNVGKSTLFNRIIGDRRAIVGDEPGITRDRIHGLADYRGKRFELIDTGGIVPKAPDLIAGEIFKQARVAIEGAAHIIFIVDGRAEITAPDRELAQMLRRLGKPVTVAVNKIDVPQRQDLVSDFYSLGFERVVPVSAEHGLGLDELLESITRELPAIADPGGGARPRIKVAIVGRPNVGKSTLLNALVGQERTIVAPEAGTTRDAVDEVVERDGIEFVFIDTAGIRRKGKTRLMAEKLSVVMARRHIRLANVVLQVLDATEGVVALDATIGGYAHEGGRPLILCVNKWDIAPDKDKAAFLRHVRDSLRFLDYVPLAFVSAARGAGLEQLFALIRRGHEAASTRVSTGQLNRFLAGLALANDVGVKYMTQVSVRPPTFVVFTDGPRKLHFSTERYLINQLRETFGLAGTPIVIKTKTRPPRKGAR